MTRALLHAVAVRTRIEWAWTRNRYQTWRLRREDARKWREVAR